MFDDVIVILILETSSKWDSVKSGRFSRVLTEYLKNSSTDFHQTYVIFRQSYIGFEIKDCCHGNQFIRECWAK